MLYWSGRVWVDTKVAIIAQRPGREYFQMQRISWGRYMSSTPMRIRRPARAGRGMSSATGPAKRMSSPTTMPEKMFAALVSAPALTLSAVAESDPLAGAH